MSPHDKQVGGDHYRLMAIQPLEYIQKNRLDFIQGNLVKYATRYPHKGQRVADLEKIIHYAQLALAEEAQVSAPVTDADGRTQEVITSEDYLQASPASRLAQIDALIAKHADRNA